MILLIPYFLLLSYSQVEKHLSEHLIEPVELKVIVKRRLGLDKSDLPLIEIEGSLELFKVNIWPFTGYYCVSRSLLKSAFYRQDFLDKLSFDNFSGSVLIDGIKKIMNRMNII